MKWLKEHGGLVALALVVSVGLMAHRAPEGYFTDTGSIEAPYGNLKIGNATPTVAMDGKDAYIEGTLETAGIHYPYGGNAILMVEDYITTTSANTILAAEMYGKHFTMTSTGDDKVTHNLPTAVVGMWSVFSDMDSTAGADLSLNPQNADQINGSTAGVAWDATGDAVFPESCLIYCRAAGQWVLIPLSGTWGSSS